MIHPDNPLFMPHALNRSIPKLVEASVTSWDRLSPLLSGASAIRSRGAQARLTVRAAGEDLEIVATARLLNLVFERCDGTRTVNEILGSFTDAGERSEFEQFVAFLLQEGALIDANLVVAQAVRFGYQYSPFGLAAPASVTDNISRRFLWNNEEPSSELPAGAVKIDCAPLDAFVSARVTGYTFDDCPVSESSLHSMLWSLAGVITVDHPRIRSAAPLRTIASAGGMHLLEIFVALQRQVGRYTPGLYRVEYPAARSVLLHLLDQNRPQLALAFGKPWELKYSTGAVFVAADPVVAAMRYRNRSLQYLFMEAGAALHNGALSADALNMGYATIGGYYERPIARLCQLDRQLLLGSAIFGARASAEQIALTARSPKIDFAWVNGESAQYTMGFHLARAKILADDEDDRPHTWGRSTDPELAVRKAIAEAIEREGFRQPREIVDGCVADIDGALDPRLFVLYAGSQYANPDFFYQPFLPDQTYAWAKAIDLRNGQTVRVLGELVYSRASLAAAGHTTSRPYTQVTSSGCAASTTAEDATLRAILEVIERDAFMQHWLKQQPGLVIPANQWPLEIRQRVEPLLAAGCQITIQKLTVPWAQVALVAARHLGQHFTTIGTAASENFTHAVDSAMDEVEARVYAWIHGHLPSIRNPQEVQTTEHHFELYGLKRHYKRADRVLFPATEATNTPWPEVVPELKLKDLVERLASHGMRPIAANITPKHNCVDQGRTPLAVVKALIPGLLPISFGHQREPLGMVRRVHPGSKFPHPFP